MVEKTMVPDFHAGAEKKKSQKSQKFIFSDVAS